MWPHSGQDHSTPWWWIAESPKQPESAQTLQTPPVLQTDRLAPLTTPARRWSLWPATWGLTCPVRP